MGFRIVPVIMCGGRGARLWPLSTEQKPKPFLRLQSPYSLLQHTVLRFRAAPPGLEFLPPILAGSAAHEGLLARELSEIGVEPGEVLLEPAARNTAATVAAAAAAVLRQDSAALALLVPADHQLQDPDPLLAALACAAPLAGQRICCFGVPPSRPETGYGYIHAGAPLAPGVFAIDSFKEKPSLSLAEAYVASGEYFWNSGVFLFAPRFALEQFRGSAAAIRDVALASYAGGARAGSRVHLGAMFASAPAQPFDVAVMETCAHGAVVSCALDWTDVGAWPELLRAGVIDARGNNTSGAVALTEAAGSQVLAEGVVVAALGIENLLVVATPEAVLIAPRGREGEFAALVEAARALKSQ